MPFERVLHADDRVFAGSEAEIVDFGFASRNLVSMRDDFGFVSEDFAFVPRDSAFVSDDFERILGDPALAPGDLAFAFGASASPAAGASSRTPK